MFTFKKHLILKIDKYAEIIDYISLHWIDAKIKTLTEVNNIYLQEEYSSLFKTGP